MEKGVKGVGVSGPEREDLGSTWRQDDGALETGPDLVQDFATVHGFGPRFNGWQLDGAGLGVVAQLGSSFGDLGVKGFKADLKALGLGMAQAVILGGWK